MQNESAAVEGFRRLRAAAEVELGVHIVFDQRHRMLLEQLHEILLGLFRHQGAERVLEIRHQPAHAHRMSVEDARQRPNIGALSGERRDLDSAQPQGLDRLQAPIERGRFDGHDVAGASQHLQTQIQAFERPGRDDGLILRNARAAAQVAPRDLAPQLGAAGRQIIQGAPWVHLTCAGAQTACEPAKRKQHWTGKRRAERHDVAVADRFEHLEYELAHVHPRRSRLASWRRRSRRARSGLPDTADEETRSRAGLDEAVRFEQLIGMDYGCGTEPAIAGQLSDRRDAVSHLERPIANGGREVVSQLTV